jgi:hypothetical protein
LFLVLKQGTIINQMNLIVASTWVIAIFAAHIVTLKAIYLQGIADKLVPVVQSPVNMAADKVHDEPVNSMEAELLEHVFSTAAIPSPLVADDRNGPVSLAAL